MERWGLGFWSTMRNFDDNPVNQDPGPAQAVFVQPTTRLFLCGRLAPTHMAIQPEVPQDDAATRTAVATPRLSLKDWFRCATIVLIALNMLMFLMMALQGVSVFNPTADSVLRWGADYGPLTLHGQWWRMLVSTFLHFGLIHLLFNMFVLFNIGLFLEGLATFRRKIDTKSSALVHILV